MIKMSLSRSGLKSFQTLKGVMISAPLSLEIQASSESPSLPGSTQFSLKGGKSREFAL